MVDMSYMELKKMVSFFYSMNYDDEIPEETGQETGSHISLLQLHARMFAVGDRYDILGLRRGSQETLFQGCSVQGVFGTLRVHLRRV
jgi:hypothetical protein